MRALIEIEYLMANTQVEEVDDSLTSPGCNVSNVVSATVPSNKFQGYKGFHFAGTVGEWPAIANGDYKYYPDEGYMGFCSQMLSAADGTTNIKIVFTLSGEVPSYINLQFDKVCNEYATEFVISNNQNSNKITVNNVRYRSFVNIEPLNITAAAVLTLTITKWSKPFKNIKITKITFGFTGQYTDNELESFKCSEQLLDSRFQIKPGVIEQYADISFKDRYGELQDLAVQGFLMDNLTVSIYAIDDQKEDPDNPGQPMYILQGIYKTDTWDVTGTSNSVKLSCKDITRSFETVQVRSVDIQTRNVHEMLALCFGYFPEISWTYIDTDTENYCKSIVTPNSWLYASTLEDTLQKVCNLGMLRCYWFTDRIIVARCY